MQNFLINDINTIVNFHIKYKGKNEEVISDLNQLGFNISELNDISKISKGDGDTYLSNLQTKIIKMIKYKTQLSYICYCRYRRQI